MADSNVQVTEGSGKNIDTRTEANGDHRQVITVGDPSATDAIAEVRATDPDSNSEGVVVRDIHTSAIVSALGGTISVKTDPDAAISGIASSVAVYFDRGNPAVNANISGQDSTLNVQLDPGHELGSIKGINSTVAVYFDPSAPAVSATFSGTQAVYFDQSNPKVSLGSDTVTVDATGSGDVPITLDGERVDVQRVHNVVDGTIAVSSVSGTVNVHTDTAYIEGINSTVAVYFDQSNPAVDVGRPDIQRVHNVVDGTISVSAVSGTTAVYFDQSNPSVNVGTPNVYDLSGTANTQYTASGSASGGRASGNTVVSPTSSRRIKVHAFSLTTTAQVQTVATFEDGAGAGGGEVWRAALQAPAQGISGITESVTPPAYLFAMAANTTLALHLDNASLVHYSVSYTKETD
jgi:hypothetical protein